VGGWKGEVKEMGGTKKVRRGKRKKKVKKREEDVLFYTCASCTRRKKITARGLGKVEERVVVGEN
jgi:hypothetical protein